MSHDMRGKKACISHLALGQLVVGVEEALQLDPLQNLKKVRNSTEFFLVV